MMLAFLISTFFLVETPFDKIEKQGTLLNASCTLFGTRCTAGSKISPIQYTYIINELDVRLVLRISEEEAGKSKPLLMLLKNNVSIELNEPMTLPSDVCRLLNMPSNYTIPSGFYRVNYKNNVFDIQLLK
jgi:hypothetical protein